MDLAHSAELILGVIAAMAALAAIARWLSLPYPVLFVLGGLVLAVVPGLPTVSLDPELVFLLFLPPLIYSAGTLTSLRDIQANILAISLLAVGLVLATTAVVALVASAVLPGLPWLTALAIGAIVSPTDASAVLALARRMRLPRALAALIEGESLFNDATALVLYRATVAAAISGSFSPASIAPSLVLALLGGIAVGLVVGWLLTWIRGLSYISDDSLIEVTLSLLTPFVAWIIAEAIGVSGVVAVVTAGVYAGRTRLSRLPSSTRLLEMGFWQVLGFVLEGSLFILIGLQLRTALGAVDGGAISRLVLPALILSASLIALRVAWVLLAVRVSRSVGAAGPGHRVESWREALVVAWAETRGGVSLAAALALPFTLPSGEPFPGRGEAVFLTFGIVLATLLLQGPTLRTLVHRLEIGGDDATEREELLAREEIGRKALGRVGELANREDVPDRAATEVRHDLERDVREARGELGEGQREHVEAARRLRREVLAAQREQMISLRDEGVVTDEVLRRIERELDLEELSLDEAPTPKP